MAAWHTDPNAPLPRWERCCFWLADDTSEAVLASDVFEAGAPQQNLAGAATGAAQASGALDHGVSLGGAASAAGGAAAGLAVSVPLAVSAAAAAFTAAQLAIAKAMGGAATGQGSAAAGLLLAKALAAVAGGQAQALGDLGLAKLLAAAAGAQGLATGDLQAGAVGTITFTADHELRNNLGTVWASQSGITVHVYTAAGARARGHQDRAHHGRERHSRTDRRCGAHRRHALSLRDPPRFGRRWHEYLDGGLNA